MLENITLGQYYPVKSPVHALDPRVKILLLIAYITGVFIVPDLTGFLLVEPERSVTLEPTRQTC